MPVTRTTSFPTNVVISDALGTPASPTGGYFGFANALGTQVASTGPRLWAGNGNPNTVLTAPLGSQWTNTATGLIYVNTNGATAWTEIAQLNAPISNWGPLYPQTSLDPSTDYFTTGVLDPKWTTWNPGANTTVTVSASTRLNIVQPTGVDKVGGIFQPCPAYTRYAITALIGVDARAINFPGAGLLIGGNLITNPATDPFVYVPTGPSPAPLMYVSGLNFTDYLTFGGTLWNVNNIGFQTILMRIFVDTIAQTYQFLTSGNGYTWSRWNSTTFAGSAMGAVNPTVIGVCANNVNSGADQTALCSMFRVDQTTNPYLACGGFA